MVDIAPTASQVLPGTGTDAVFLLGVAGATITAGQVVYLDPAANTYKLFDCDLTSANTRRGVIALNGASAGQPIKVQIEGLMTLGAAAAMTIGITYVASATAGGIAPIADVAINWRVNILGVAATASTIYLHTWNSAVTKAA